MTFAESRAWDAPQKNPKTIETYQIITVQVECRRREQTSFSVLLIWMWERCRFNTSLRHKAQVCAQFNLVLSHWGSDTAAKVSRIQRGTARAGRCHGARLNNEAGRTVRRRAVETNVVKKKKLPHTLYTDGQYTLVSWQTLVEFSPDSWHPKFTQHPRSI